MTISLSESVAGPASPSASAQQFQPATPGPASAEQQRHAPPQNEPETRVAYSISQWDPPEHARLTFNSLGKHFAELVHAAEVHLARELAPVKAYALQLEQRYVAVAAERDTLLAGKAIALTAAEAERQAAGAARAAVAKEQAAVAVAFNAAKDLATACAMLRHQLNATQTELQQVKGERESLRVENWQLKEVVAKLSRDVHLSERERKESNPTMTGDSLLSSALAEVRGEHDRRMQVEQELTELKAKISKQALLQTSGTSTTWPEMVSALPKLAGLPDPFSGTQLGSETRHEHSATERQSSLPTASETFMGLATPQSQVGTVDMEPVAPERDMSEVIDLTMSDGAPSPLATTDRKRPASPPMLDEMSALKRRRTEELCASERGPQARDPSPERPSSSSMAIHEFGAAPLLMGLTSTPETAPPAERDADPDQTLVDERNAHMTTSDATPSESKPDLKELQGEMKPDVTSGPGDHTGQQGAGLQEPMHIAMREEEEEEEEEIKEEAHASPQLAPSPKPTLSAQNEPLRTPTPKVESPRLPCPLPRGTAGSTAGRGRPMPPFRVHSLPNKPMVPTKSNTPVPPKPSVFKPLKPEASAPVQRPPLRRSLTISHIHLAYDEAGSRYTCVMCKRRHEKDRTFRVASFSTDSSWDTLAGHVEREHPMGFERLVNMSLEQIAEANLRKK
ncbi:uncharacterized protein B0H18DRAFT_1120718 [Fomitopsis serialis]|uniref:uncharacterized protein n=1 Tax=Fomitopsis serialis TaxID=139415 RepID=UPI002007CB47|nr:uncharacterized protein B0H18DRAFT_1120718 [Neoantrodia serialis]KAH9922722.1 hypothetical protein B0H18DRAFT_1120718 [Neoantrodia serialis]